MEYEGIISGIGNKDLGKNIIKPEFDAYINKFIIGKNTILEGLKLNGNKLSAGSCVLCGYRGIIEEEKTLQINKFVYAKFVLYFDDTKEDEFYIEETETEKSIYTNSINPQEITQAGTYYLLLYVNGVLNSSLDTENSYPLNSQFSVETDKVLDGAEIESGVEGVTQLVNDNSTKIATTEYVHNQIEEEIDYGEISGILYNTSETEIGTYTAKRKSKYVILEIIINLGGTIKKFLPDDFLPTQTIYFAIPQSNGFAMHSIDNKGQMALIGGSAGVPDDATRDKYISIGYQCK